MCLGLASGYIEPQDKITMFKCESCGGVWRVERKTAEEYKRNGNICDVCRKLNKEKPKSFLKPYTNFEKIKAMSVDEMAKFLQSCCNCTICYYFYETCRNNTDDISCIGGVKQWLESEAEDNG